MGKEDQKLAVYQPSAPLPSGPRCIDLFSGAGGLAIGFKQAGWAILAANDFDAAAGETFRLNFPESTFLQGPVSKVTAAQLMVGREAESAQVDAIIGGPPCQSFSYNNHQRNAEDDRARLFSCYLKIVSKIKPKCLVMENVPGILTIGGGKVVKEIRSTLLKMKYDCEVVTLSAEEFGTPQVRKRVFILASRIGQAAELIPIATHRAAKSTAQGDMWLPNPITVGEAIGDLPAVENGCNFQVSAYSAVEPSSEFQIQAREGSAELFNHVCHRLTDVNLNRMKHVPEGGNWRNIPRELLTAGMQRAHPSDHTKRYGRLASTGLASTLLTKCDPHWGAYVHPHQDRTITVREAARLQGFPDTFRFAGDKLGLQYEQVGNAVPAPLARAIGERVALHIAMSNRRAFAEAAE
ncbi:DNA cytosine methyltransferase [Rhizobium sp. NZLR1]|uniref:DNA cytosine methyltransferase n=1 Tax=Rhizobium sp. NZLR1 TaxID=2731096 RepID=UPI001A9988B1|nr:DNA cytosine methyltransferase [Rhizobium sp. NZLR1]MBX5206107.1 DNA cytosine methyltransferase [Rhizobium sp. NZLR1]QSZ21521.1 DNA cytosine methyltransferase [Rhizobium sp. NZLR1]